MKTPRTRARLLGGLLLAAVLPTCGGAAPDPAPATTRAPLPDAPPEPEPAAIVDPPPPPAEPPANDADAQKIRAAVAVARDISSDPEHADEVLARHGLDREKLDAMMYEIAADPALTDAYMAARRAS